MKIFDLLRVAVKSLKGRWAVLPALGMAIAMFCFCFAGAVIVTVGEQKAQPYELEVQPGAAGLTDNDVLELSQKEGVTAVTPILTVPAQITAGEYSAQIMLSGINGDYLEDEFLSGGIFPDSSMMPYIVLNEKALKLFKQNDKAIDESLEIDWLHESTALSIEGSARPIVSKISGVLKSDEQSGEALAYISLYAAKQLLQQNGQPAGYTGAKVRIEDMGSAESVAKGIMPLGLSVANPNEQLQSEWDAQTKEAGYLLTAGVFSLLCSAVLTAAWIKIALFGQREAYSMLLLMGMKRKTLRRLFTAQCAIIAFSGVALGLIVSASLPAFLSAGMQEESILMLSAPAGVIGISAAVIIIAGLLPSIGAGKNIAEL